MSAGSNKGKAHSAKKGRGQEASNPLWDDVILLFVLAFCILLFLSYFHLAGRVGEWIGSFMFGFFGMVSYVVPIALFFAVAFFLSNRGKSVAWVKVVSAIVFVIILCCFASLAFLKKEVILQLGLTQFYSYCQTDHLSGGLLGCLFSWIFLKSIGSAATWVLLIVLMIISVVLITEKSFFKGVKKGSESIYHSAKDDMQRRRERRIEKAEQLRQYEAYQMEASNSGKVLRTDKKVSGVMVDTTLRAEKQESDDIREITDSKKDDENRSDYYALKNDHSINIRENDDFVDDYVDDVIPQKSGKKKKGTDKTKQTADEEIVINKESVNPDGYRFPPINILEKGKKTTGDSAAHLNQTAAKLEETLLNFGVKATVTDISQGPTVTRYELEPDAGVKVSKIVGLSDDIKLRMAATDIRIEAPIPGKAAVGIEIPNANNATVMFRDLIETETFQKASSKISFAVGKDLGGDVVVADIAKMPHMLIAGATGSGKSVCINTLIMSILYKARPDEVKLIMIDPKVVELSVYNGIPHLMIPVVTDPKKAAAALQWGVNEMTDRYNKFADLGVRDLSGYNRKVETLTGKDASEEDREKYAKMPQIVIIVDELADLMMVAPGDVEDSICRLAQLARAAGIHLIIATQRPSVDVITGLIKANMPSRVAFSVSSGVDSRTILDMNGAEKLLGKGDMLFYPQGYPKPSRIQGAYISDSEVQSVVDFLIKNSKGASYNADMEEKIKSQMSAPTLSDGSDGEERDELYAEAGKFIIENDKASIGNLQRRFKIGFNRAARIMDQLADDEVVSKSEGTKARQVLMSMEQFMQFLDNET